jgi:fructuronate reductase
MKLSRQNQVARAPERMVHMGLGAFFRAHQAWYTQQADPENQWGYVAFTGRSAKAADELEAQDGLYTLITRGPAGDAFDLMTPIVRAADGNDLGAFTAAVANPQTALVTLTITEAGYALAADGSLLDGAAQLAALATGTPNTALGRLAWALNERRQQRAGAIALVSCDNIPSNGQLLEGAMKQLMAVFGEPALNWMTNNVSFVSTSIDRITPKTTAAEVSLVAQKTGFEDASPVVTEPFHDWVLQGDFPAGRPAWEDAGARFVDHIEPFENRKLWLLNGSHSLLAYLGQLFGHTTVADAIADSRCLAAVENFWNEAQRTLNDESLNVPEYRAALLERFGNGRIAHQLAQIAIDGSTKVRVRIVPTAKAELAAGRSASGAATAIGAWITYRLSADKLANGLAADSRDSELAAIVAQSEGSWQAAVPKLVALLDPELAKNEYFLTQVGAVVTALHLTTQPQTA